MIHLNSEKLLSIAKKSIKNAVNGNPEWLPEIDEKWMEIKQGVFTTIYTKTENSKQLRGCIGLPDPTEMLGHAIAISARKSALEDPRFEPLTVEELPNIIISVELLSKYSKLEWSSYEDLKSKIDLGIHGLRIQFNKQAGILLPRVPLEHHLTKDEYLQTICKKAGLPLTVLKEEEVELYKFTSQFFSEY